MKYSEDLIERMKKYMKEKANIEISDEEAENYLDSFASLLPL